jgi:hypothetical protein
LSPHLLGVGDQLSIDFYAVSGPQDVIRRPFSAKHTQTQFRTFQFRKLLLDCGQLNGFQCRCSSINFQRYDDLTIRQCVGNLDRNLIR